MNCIMNAYLTPLMARISVNVQLEILVVEEEATARFVHGKMIGILLNKQNKTG